MKIDIHTHVTLEKEHISAETREVIKELWGEGSMNMPAEEHWEKTAQYTDKTIVFGSRFQAAGMMVDDDYVAQYVAQHPETLIGFMSIDPTIDTPDLIEHRHIDSKMKGVKLSPFYSNCALLDERFQPFFAEAERLHLPLMIHLGPAFPRTCFMKYCDPSQLEELACRYPKLRMVVAHMGYPWEYEVLHVVRRYPNLFVDMSAMVQQPWDFYNNMVRYYEWNCMDKILLGSDFPFGTWEETQTGLMNVNYMVEGTRLPHIPEKELLRIAEQNSLEILGIDG